jgi:hypothetical protein
MRETAAVAALRARRVCGGKDGLEDAHPRVVAHDGYVFTTGAQRPMRDIAK